MLAKSSLQSSSAWFSFSFGISIIFVLSSSQPPDGSAKKEKKYKLNFSLCIKAKRNPLIIHPTSLINLNEKNKNVSVPLLKKVEFHIKIYCSYCLFVEPR